VNPCLYTSALAMLLLLSTVPAPAAVSPSAELPQRAASSTVADQTDIAVTIYNINMGLVKDQRAIQLAPGRSELRFMDVASQIIPTSVSFRSLAEPDRLQVLEQNYEYDLLNQQKLLDKYVGKEVRLYQKNPHSEREEIVNATIVSNNGGPIYRIGNDITFGHPGRILFPGIPDDLIAKPTLVWLLENSLDDTQTVEATYLTNGITWRADYVLTLNETDDRTDLSGWVTIDNRSGATYRNASLKLVAGDVNRLQEEPVYRERLLKTTAMPAAVPSFKEESFFEYHIYTLQRPATVKDNQSKQINLVTASTIPVRKEFLLKGQNSYYYSPYGETMANQKVGVYVEIDNRKEHNLGMPLPKGTVRVYKHDSDGSLQFVGEDAIDHTPKDEKVRVKLGDAFDVVGTRKQTDWKKTATDTYEAAFEVTLRNHKKEDVVVKVVEPVPGDWTMLSSSMGYRKGDAFTAEFQVPVAKDGEAKLTYRVRMRY
jgi:hypothetical protein